MLHVLCFNIIQLVAVRGAPQTSNVYSFVRFCIDTSEDGLSSGRNT